MLDAVQFAAGDDVESRAGLGQQAQNAEISVGLHGVADAVRHAGETELILMESAEDALGRVDVAWRLGACGNLGQIDAAAEKGSLTVLERAVH